MEKAQAPVTIHETIEAASGPVDPPQEIYGSSSFSQQHLK